MVFFYSPKLILFTVPLVAFGLSSGYSNPCLWFFYPWTFAKLLYHSSMKSFAHKILRSNILINISMFWSRLTKGTDFSPSENKCKLIPGTVFSKLNLWSNLFWSNILYCDYHCSVRLKKLGNYKLLVWELCELEQASVPLAAF